MVKPSLQASIMPYSLKQVGREGNKTQNLNPVVFEERICSVCRGSLSFQLRWDQRFPTFCTSPGRRLFVLFEQLQNGA